MKKSKAENSDHYYFSNIGTPALLSISHRSIEAHLTNPRTAHSHPDQLEIYYVTAGNGEILLDGRVFSVRKGDLIGVNSNIVHDENPERNAFSTYVFSITGVSLPFMQPNHIVPSGHSPQIKSSEETEFIHKLMKLIEYDADLRGRHQNNITISLLQILIYKLMLMFQENLSEYFAVDNHSEYSYNLVMNTKEYVDHHYMEDLTLDDLARHATLSSSYISRMFKHYFGFSPMQYLARRRIGEAESLLILTDEPITVIALKCGYSSPSNFNRVFQKYLGISPKEYRKNHRIIQIMIQ